MDPDSSLIGEPKIDRNPAPPTSWRIALWAAGIAGALLLVLRWYYVRSFLWNSDEPQHLHVVWAWANGLLPYRDVFDNHTPLFHLLSVPIFRFFGERPDIILQMRMAMIPLFALSLWCVYRIGAQIFSPTAGLWSAILLGLFPKYFFLMGQFRTDVLWTVFWLGTLTVLTGGTLTPRRCFFVGLLIGAAFAVSMKTVLLLIVILAAGALSWSIRWILGPRDREPATATTRPLLGLTAALGGLLLIPALILGYFAARGALAPLYYCVITHNTLPGSQTSYRVLHRLATWHWLFLPPALALAAAVQWRSPTDRRRTSLLVFLILAAALFDPVLESLWPTITRQDYVPWYPLVALLIPPVILLLEKWTVRWGPLCAAAALVLLSAGETHWVLHHAPIFGPGSVPDMAAIADTLRLTDPGEYVMDPKGDLIFRPRPYYYVLETITLRRLNERLLKDDLPERLTETRTAVIKNSTERLTHHSQEFVEANYIPIGHLAVLGQILAPEKEGKITFNVTIPERYEIVTAAGPILGTLDRQPLNGPRWLEAGPHELELPHPSAEVVLIWSRASERGFSPFPLAANFGAGT